MVAKRISADPEDVADEAALVLALDRVTRRAELERREQVADKLREEGWRAAAEFCASVQQSETLRLRPWQQPPCNIDPDLFAPSEAAAAELLRRMLAAGVSRFTPIRSPRSPRRSSIAPRMPTGDRPGHFLDSADGLSFETIDLTA